MLASVGACQMWGVEDGRCGLLRRRAGVDRRGGGHVGLTRNGCVEEDRGGRWRGAAARRAGVDRCGGGHVGLTSNGCVEEGRWGRVGRRTDGVDGEGLRGGGQVWTGVEDDRQQGRWTGWMGKGPRGQTRPVACASSTHGVRSLLSLGNII
eukprot:355152-Chlamydomonas_euryale.AAC.1